MRQNSLTIWDMQERWNSRVDDLIEQLGGKERDQKRENGLRIYSRWLKLLWTYPRNSSHV